MRNSSALVLIGKESEPADLRDLAEVSRDRSLHLSIFVIGTLPAIPMYSYGTGLYGSFEVPAEWHSLVEQKMSELSAVSGAVGEMLAAEGVEADIRVLCSDRDGLSENISRRALSADVVIPANDLRKDERLFKTALHAAIFDSSAGVLLNATGAPNGIAPKRVFVAWNYGAQAGRAVRASMPLLRDAEEVVVAIFDPVMSQYADGENPCSDVARWLTHHGCKVTVQQFPSGGEEIGSAIKTRATEAGADLIVMGAYDHSRIREIVFGGTTQTMIEQASMRVLFAH